MANLSELESKLNRTRTVAELQFKRTSEPMATVEINLDSIPSDQQGYGQIVQRALSRFAGNSPLLRATVYVYEGPSINFGVPGYSAFFGVAGSKQMLNELHSVFSVTPEIQVRYSDVILASRSLCQYHVEDGKLWLPLEEGVWYNDEKGVDTAPEERTADTEASDDPGEWPDEADGDGTPNDGTDGRGEVARRVRSARSDASISSIRRTIESVFGLPEGSVALRGPDGKNIKGNASIATLRKRWQ